MNAGWMARGGGTAAGWQNGELGVVEQGRSCARSCSCCPEAHGGRILPGSAAGHPQAWIPCSLPGEGQQQGGFFVLLAPSCSGTGPCAYAAGEGVVGIRSGELGSAPSPLSSSASRGHSVSSPALAPSPGPWCCSQPIPFPAGTGRVGVLQWELCPCCWAGCPPPPWSGELQGPLVGVRCVLRTRTRPHQEPQGSALPCHVASCSLQPCVVVPAAVQAVGATRGTSSQREGWQQLAEVMQTRGEAGAQQEDSSGVPQALPITRWCCSWGLPGALFCLGGIKGGGSCMSCTL